MGSTTLGQNWFAGQGGTGGGPDFAGYQGEPLWTNPYQPRGQMDWARAEHAAFPGASPHGLHPDYDPTLDFQQMYATMNRENPLYGTQAWAKNVYWPAKASEARMEHLLGPNAPYWADEYLAEHPNIESKLREWQQDVSLYRGRPDEWNQLAATILR